MFLQNTEKEMKLYYLHGAVCIAFVTSRPLHWIPYVFEEVDCMNAHKEINMLLLKVPPSPLSKYNLLHKTKTTYDGLLSIYDIQSPILIHLFNC